MNTNYNIDYLSIDTDLIKIATEFSDDFLYELQNKLYDIKDGWYNKNIMDRISNNLFSSCCNINYDHEYRNKILHFCKLI